MAGNIKGITIEFRGETTKLSNALKQIGKETRSIDNELNKVNKALKFNPTSVELWRQKQELLTKKIGETDERLKLLKDQQKQMDAAGVEKSSDEYRNLQREIIETESKLKTFKGQLKQVGNVKLRAMSEQFKQLGTSLEKAGQAMRGFSAAGAAATTAIAALAVKSGEWADDLNTMSKIYGISTTELQKYSAAANLVDVSVETIASTHRRLTKAMAGTEDETGAQAEAFAKLGIETTNADGSLRDADTVWQETIAALGNMENETERDAIAMELMGKSASELNPLIEDGGETYQKMAETMQKYGLDFIDEDTLAKANEFNDTLDTMKALGMTALQTVGAQLAGYLAPALAKVADLVGKFAGWLAQLDPRVLTIIATIGGVMAVVAPLLIGLGKVAFAISSIMNLMAVIGPAIGGIVAALGPVILIIGAVVAAGILLYKNWDTIKAKALEIWTYIKTVFGKLKTTITTIFNGIRTTVLTVWNGILTKVRTVVNTIRNTVSTVFNNLKGVVTTVWNGIKTAIVTPIQNARDTVKRVIDKIKGLFPLSIGKIFSNLKIPKINVSGGKAPFGIGGLGKAPSISVDWHAQGGIFDRPTLLTDRNGNIHGLGEAGAEAIMPLDPLWEKLDRIAEASASGGNIVINVQAAPGMNTAELAAEVEKRLIAMQKRRRNAWV